ncbi:mucosal addressin cell adhesion molecule 1 [Cavia porcellus]|uniref:mucosal addressin cell adhesion molecule 1 n=1 Tax=Cavia porcellus TaxID=10141 RepID=UPI002FE17645
MVRGLQLLLVLGLLRPGEGQPLLVEPADPVVAVALGASRDLTCSLACAPGPAAVHWRGLDTGLGSVRSDPGRSVLWLHRVSLRDEGPRVCRGSCGGRTFQHRVQVLVYAFPDQLTVSPAALEPEQQDAQVGCTAHNVTPWDPDTLSFSLILGDQELEGVQILGREEEEEEEATPEAEGPLFRVTQRWLLPALRPRVPTTLHCQVTMRLPGLELSHRQPLPVLHSRTTPELPSPSLPETPDPTSLKPSNLISPEPPESTATAHPESSSTAHPESSSTAHPESSSTVHPKSTSTAHPESTSIEHPESTSTAHPESISVEPRDPLSPHSTSSPRSCRPEILQAPPAVMEKATGWGLLCQAPCGPGVTVRWTLAPRGLAAYQRREAGARAWLSALLTDPAPEGWFQCRLEPGGQVASLYVPGQSPVPSASSSPEVVPQPTALWMGGVALGLLLLLAPVAYHLWKHQWSAAGDLTHPPVCLGLRPGQDSEKWLATPLSELQGPGPGQG